MHLKQEQKLWLAVSKDGPWYPLAAGIFQQKSRLESTKHRWFELGMETQPQEEIIDTVKVIALRFHLKSEDEGQKLLLQSHGKSLWLMAKNGEIIDNISSCRVEILGEENAAANEAAECSVQLHISQKIPTTVKVFT